MTIAVCLLQALAIAVVRRRWVLITSAAAIGTVAFGVALVAFPTLAAFVVETLTWQNASSVAHLDDYLAGLENALRYPLGAGLGVADQAAVRAGFSPLAGDNQYLTYAVQLGIVGLCLHLATILGGVLFGVKAAREGPSAQADYGFVVATAAVGILLNATTAGVFNSILLTSVFFWILGSLVTSESADGLP